MDFDDLRDTTRRCYRADIGMQDQRWTSRFHSDERQVPRCHSGRVLLAGTPRTCTLPPPASG